MHKTEKEILEEIKSIEHSIKRKIVPEDLRELAKSRSNKVRSLCSLIVTNKEVFLLDSCKAEPSTISSVANDNTSKSNILMNINSLQNHEHSICNTEKTLLTESSKHKKDSLGHSLLTKTIEIEEQTPTPNVVFQTKKKKKAIINQVDIESLAQDPCSSVRAFALKHVKSLSILKSFFNDSNTDVKIAVLEALNKIQLGKKQQKKVIAQLAAYINDKNVCVRLEFSKLLKNLSLIGISKLMQMFDKEDIGTFIFGAEDESVEVRKEILNSIFTLVYTINRNINNSTHANCHDINEQPKDDCTTYLNCKYGENAENHLQNYAEAIFINQPQNQSSNKDVTGVDQTIFSAESKLSPEDKLTTQASELKKVIKSVKKNKKANKTKSAIQRTSSDNESDIETLAKEKSLFSSLLDVIFDYISDVLNDSSEVVRLAAAKFLSKISTDFLIEKETCKVLSVLLNIKEAEIAPFILETIENLIYFDTDIGLALSRFLSLDQMIISFKKIVIKNIFLFEREFKLNGQIYNPSKHENYNKDLIIILNSEAYKTIQEHSINFHN